MQVYVLRLRYSKLASLIFSLFLALNVSIVAKANDEHLPRGTIHFERLVDGQYIIKTQVNGQGPFRFMIDTGASRTSIFEETQGQLGLTDSGLAERSISGMTTTELRPVIRIDSLSFADIKFKQHDIIILEDWPRTDTPGQQVDGILGMDVLNNLILSVTHKDKRMKIRRNGKVSQRSVRRWAKFSFEPNPYPGKDYGLMFTNTKIGELYIPTMFDTGSGFTALSWNIVEGGKLGKEKRRLKEEWIVQGAIGEFKPKIRIVLDKFVVDGLVLRRHTLLVMDFDKLPINGYGQYPMVIVGADVLGDYDFILDLKEWHLYLDAPLRAQGKRGGMRARSKIDAITVVVP